MKSTLDIAAIRMARYFNTTVEEVFHVDGEGGPRRS
ncbi:MAG: hypothetical protein JWR24_4899 [Actinoallomurus sp.]|jgi:DNA-binding XRE family transcriptional regulator|nr:hypothetical protein [Actinoallomurus sp.]